MSRLRSPGVLHVVLAVAAVAPVVACETIIETRGAAGNGGSASTDTTTSTDIGGAGGAIVVTGGAGAGGEGGTPDPWEPIANLKELDLGVVDLDNTVYWVPVPDRTIGFTLLAEAMGGLDTVVAFAQLKPPAGGYQINNYAMVGHPEYVFGDTGWVAASNPQTINNDSWPVQSGQWLYKVGSDTSGQQAHVRVYVRRTSDGAFHGGVLDVNVFIAPGTVQQSYVQGVLNHLFTDHYGPSFGVTAGTITFQSLASGYTTIGDYNELRTMFASSQGVGSAPALNLFVVGNFAGASFGGAIGVAGGIPGSPMRHGTVKSGVAWQPQGQQTYDASVLAHEIGHLSGLFHTTEFAVQETDPLYDTPECAWSTIQNNPNNCPDVSNVMFPIAYGGNVFSGTQTIVFQGSALYRGSMSQGAPPTPPLSPPHPPLSPFAPDARFELWAGDLPTRPPAPGLEQALAGAFCADAPDSFALGEREAKAAGAERLSALVHDPSAMDLVRARALSVLLKLPGALDARAAGRLLRELVASEQAGRTLRIAAVRSLASVDPDAARSLARSLSPRDGVLEAVLGELR